MTDAQNPAHAAVIGIGCRLPGGIRGPRQLWQALLKHCDAIGVYSPERWDQMVGLLAEQDRPEEPWQAGLIEGFEDFDHGFFGVPAEEAQQWDPLQRHLMEVTVEALADAGIPLSQLGYHRVGVYVGSASVDAASRVFAPGRSPDITEIAGAGPGMLAAPLAHYLDVRGPVRTIDTACSSTATATHEARRALQVGEIDLALVPGVSSQANLVVTQAFRGSALAPDGRSKPFDAKADGYGRSEGVAVVVLRRAQEAHSAGDRVYGVITGSYLNHDGTRTRSIGVPSTDSQVELLHGACADAGIEPSQVGYVEAHGTGTPTGDSREVKALARVFDRDDDDPLLVGSVKGTLGHMEGAAGLAGLITTCLALHHGQIPPTANHTTPREALAQHAITVPTTPTPWPHANERLAVVSSLGFSGSNGAMVLTSTTSAPTFVEDDTAVVVPLSARTRDTLAGTAADLAPTLNGGGVGLGHLAATLARRDPQRHRAGVVTDAPEQAQAALDALAEGRVHPALVGPHEAPEQAPRVVWAFSGHGTQHPQMGRLLYQHEPAFTSAMDEVLAALANQPGHAGWHPAAINPPWGVDAIQQGIFALQVALARTLVSWGITPDVVLGHSVGEIAAAHIAGALSLDEAARVVCARSRVLADLAPLGGMLATALSPAQAEAAIADTDGLAIAAENGPSTTVLTGFEPPLEELRRRLEHEGVWARRVADDTPAHSWLLEDHLDAFAAELGRLHPRDTDVDLVSTVTAKPIPGSQLDTDYWVRQLRDPVAFHDTMAPIAHTGPCLVLELGAQPVLHRPVLQTISRHALPATLLTAGLDYDEHMALHAVLAECFTRGLTPNWPHQARPPATLPPPRWNHDPEATGSTVPALDLDTIPAEELPTRLTEAVHTAVAALAPRGITEADRDTDLETLGLDSIGRHRLQSQLARLHPAIRDAVHAGVDHAPTITGITHALLRVITQRRRDRAA